MPECLDYAKATFLSSKRTTLSLSLLLTSLLSLCETKLVTVSNPPTITIQQSSTDRMAEPTTDSNSDTTPYTLVFYVPTTDTTAVLSAVHSTGAGRYPLYDQCAFLTTGTGTFRPLKGATPAIGSVGDVERVHEDRVEVFCLGRECAVKAVEKLIEAHPYEQVAYYVVKGEKI